MSSFTSAMKTILLFQKTNFKLPTLGKYSDTSGHVPVCSGNRLLCCVRRLHTSLRYTPRLKCSNEFYYCCKNKNETQINFESSTSRPRPLSQVTHTPVVLPPTRQPTSFTNSNCGQSGYAASSRLIEKFPWVVAVFRKRRANDYRFICGGSLIHPRVVMTEQQCVHS